jgi:hypothetical protein
LIKRGGFDAVYSGILVINLVLHHLGVATREPIVATAQTIIIEAYLGATIFLIVKALREVRKGSE